MVDNTARKLTRIYENLVRVDDYVGDQNDRELKRLQNYFNDLVQVPDIRFIEKSNRKSRHPL